MLSFMLLMITGQHKSHRQAAHRSCTFQSVLMKKARRLDLDGWWCCWCVFNE